MTIFIFICRKLKIFRFKSFILITLYGSLNDCFHWNGLVKSKTSTLIYERRKDEHWTMRIQKHQTKVKMYGNVHEYLNTKWTRLWTSKIKAKRQPNPEAKETMIKRVFSRFYLLFLKNDLSTKIEKGSKEYRDMHTSLKRNVHLSWMRSYGWIE